MSKIHYPEATVAAPDHYMEQLKTKYHEWDNEMEVACYTVELDDGGTMESLKVGSGEPDTFYVPGFGEGILNKLSTAAEFAKQGRTIILPSQDRGPIDRTIHDRSPLIPNSYSDHATYTQARNYNAMVRAFRPDGGDIAIVAHSYGVTIFEKMLDLDKGSKLPLYGPDTQVVGLAGAGLIEDEGYVQLGLRWAKEYMTDMNRGNAPTHEFPDPKNVTGIKSMRRLLANVPRTVRETIELGRSDVSLQFIERSVGQFVLFTYAEDDLFPEEKIEPKIVRHFKNTDRFNYAYTATESPEFKAMLERSVGWATPYDAQRAVQGELSYGGEGANHDDEQFNPRRVVSAICQILDQKSPQL